ncbi:MAG: acyl-CoA dehydrogenase [Gammaproteobacteria bacterium]|nr:acyl-CoA dehydrogenase [Gammaproteobacteria bacterium]
MDLTLDADQRMIRSAAADFLRTECPPSVARALEADPRGYSPELWAKMAELGLMGVPFPEEYGGIGRAFLDLCLVIEELGRGRVCGPFFSTVVLCGLAIARFGTRAQRREYLRPIVAGERVMSYGELEPGATWAVPPVDLTATADGEDYVLEGTKLFVPYAQVADDVLVVARTGGGGEQGVTLLLVDAKAPGVSCERLETIGPEHEHKVTFRGVRVARARSLGEPDAGWPIVKAINAWGAAAKCAEMVGGARTVLEMTIEYAQERRQFGRPIGSFQAIQHHCANMAVDVESARFIAYEAIWRLSEGLDAAKEVSAAKAWVSDAYQRVCALGHQIHGAIGFTKEHDMQLFFRHAKEAELAFGDGDYHREIVARELGL